MIGVNLDGLASSFTWEYDETSGFLNRLTYLNGMVRSTSNIPSSTSWLPLAMRSREMEAWPPAMNTSMMP